MEWLIEELVYFVFWLFVWFVIIGLYYGAKGVIADWRYGRR